MHFIPESPGDRSRSTQMAHALGSPGRRATPTAAGGTLSVWFQKTLRMLLLCNISCTPSPSVLPVLNLPCTLPYFVFFPLFPVLLLLGSFFSLPLSYSLPLADRVLGMAGPQHCKHSLPQANFRLYQGDLSEVTHLSQPPHIS